MARPKRKLDFLTEFFRSTSIHGFTYLGNNLLHVIEKLIWFLLILACLYFSVDISLESIYKFMSKTTVIGLEKDYVFWNTTIPSATFCPTEDRLDNNLTLKFCQDHNISNSFLKDCDTFLKSLANASYRNAKFIEDFPEVDKLNLKPELYMQVIYNLTNHYTTLKDNPIVTQTSKNMGKDVKLRTVPVLTEFGICYMTNSLFTVHLNAYDMIHARYNPNFSIPEKFLILKSAFFDDDVGFLSNNMPASVNVHIHGFGEVMNPIKAHGYQYRITKTYSLGSIELVSEKGLKEGSSVRQRNCRYPEENNLKYYPIYTELLCLQECRLNLVHRLCDCVPHFYPKSFDEKNWNRKICSYNELKDCFKDSGRIDYVIYLIDRRTTESSVSCDCMKNCENALLYVIPRAGDTTQSSPAFGFGNNLIMYLVDHPIIRYKRQIIFTFTDLLVNIGATVGFFMGLNVLGIIEVFYFFTFRLFFNYFKR